MTAFIMHVGIDFHKAIIEHIIVADITPVIGHVTMYDNTAWISVFIKSIFR